MYSTRYVIRSAYGIPGDAWDDCISSTCCACCVANQLYQTSTKQGSVVTQKGGRTDTWKAENFEAGVVDHLKAMFCMPCLQASIMQSSIGMPWFYALCFSSALSNRYVPVPVPGYHFNQYTTIY